MAGDTLRPQRFPVEEEAVDARLEIERVPPSEDHLRPQSPAQVAEAVLRNLPARCEALLVTVGQYSPHPAASQRILVLARSGRRPCNVADAWMAAGDEAVLAALLAQRAVAVRLGETDAMYATSWKYAWTTDDLPVEVWNSRGRLLWLDGAKLLIRRWRRDSEVAWPIAIHGYLSSDWMKRGVRLVQPEGPPIQLASQLEVSVAFDPTYDALDLVCDSSWVLSLARRLGRALDVPVTFDEDLA